VDWLHLSQDRDVVCSCEQHNEPPCSINVGNFLAEWLLASQEGLCSMELVQINDS
jgi:hypothetical protein